MDEQKNQIIDVIKQANNILVTVKRDPSIDQLAACIALTLMINELGKHGTAVFSGAVPSVLEFLEPEKTIERNTDSLQDFIISLDKSKADKLRYKIEDTVVKIFITPYRTSISDKDLEFGQGDFNVDAVIALGVHSQDDLDVAITAHGRILHDATVTSINTAGSVNPDLTSINWIDEHASSLSEMIADVADKFEKENLVDNQIATALLTGIVAETERFGNAKTSPHTMEVSAQLLTAGANQELVATKLSEPSRTDDRNNFGGGFGGGVSVDNGAGGPDASTGFIEPLTGNDPSSLEIEHDASEQGANGGGDLASAANALNVSTDSLSASAGHDGAADDVQIIESPLLDALDPSQNKPTETPEPAPADVPAPESTPSVVETPAAAQAPAEETAPEQQAPEQPALQPAAETSPQAPPVAQELPDDVAQLPAAMAPAAAASAEAQAKAEEEAALNLIKERKVELDGHARIQPFREQGEFLGEAPKVAQKDLKPASEEEKAAGDMLANTKFALTPPTMGAALNATNDNASPDVPTAALAAGDKPASPLLSHRAPGLDAPASLSDDTQKPAEDAAVPAAEQASSPAMPPVAPAVTPHYTPDTAAPAEGLIAPAFDMAAAPAAKAPAAGDSLADLEKRVEDSVAQAAGPQADEHLIDMPMPQAAPAPAAAPAVVPATPAATATPPPVPPPMPMMPPSAA